MYLLKMTTSAIDIKTNIFFYFRHDLYNHMLNSAKEGLLYFKDENAYHLYVAVSLILMNQLEESVQQLELISMQDDVKLAATVALKYARKSFESLSTDVLELDEQIKFSDSVSFYHTAFVFMAFKEYKKAVEYINKALEILNNNSEYYSLKAWILLKCQNSSLANYDDIQILLQKSLQLNSKNLDCILAISEYNLKQNNFIESLNVVNKAIVQFSSTVLPLIQKLRILLAMYNWEQAIETINRILSIDSRNLYARKIYITILLCYSADYQGALKELDIFKNIVDSEESKNVTFILECSKLFSIVCNKHHHILQETSKMLENVLQHNSDNAEVFVEMGNQSLMNNHIKEASR